MGTTYYYIAGGGFIILTLVCYYLLINNFKAALERAQYAREKQGHIIRNLIIALIVWGVAVTALSLSRFLQDFSNFPPKMMVVLIVPLAAIIWFTSSRILRDIVANTQIRDLTNLQFFRFVVEIFLWMLFVGELLPIQMTFEGWNFDVVSGITAPVVAYFFKDNKKVMVAWNILCLGLLINIVTIAILSMPTPFQVFMNEPPNTVVANFPIVLLPAFLVPLAYMLHFFSLRKLLMK